MHLEDPRFPPLLTGFSIDAPRRVIDVACGGADDGSLEAGHVVWARNTSVAELAFVFEPEVDRDACQDMRIVLQTAIADGLGAIMPSQTAIQFRWPDAVIVNGAKVGETCLIAAGREAETASGVPAWLVAAARIVLKRDLDGLEPGLVRDESSIVEEDGADLDRSRIIATIAAHMLNAVQEWHENGTRPFAERWIGRVLGHGSKAEFQTGDGTTFSAAPIGTAGGGSLMVRGSDGGVMTLAAPVLNFDTTQPGAVIPVGSPWL